MSTYYSSSNNGFYNHSIHTVPADAVAITDSEYQSLLAAQAAGKIIGNDAGRPVAVDLPPLPLDVIRERGRARVDRLAGEARQKFTTVGTYQSVEYDMAAAAATAYQKGEIVASTALQADVDAGTIDRRTGQPVTTLAEAADLILYMKSTWMTALAEIRHIRLQAKAHIMVAADSDAVQAVIDGLIWPTPAV